MSDSRVLEGLETEENINLQFSGDYFPNELLLVIAYQMSVFDVPALAIVSRFLASNSNMLWKHHTDRLYKDKSVFLVFPQVGLKELEKEIDKIKKLFDKNYHFNFFLHYNKKSFPARRRALQIIEGRISNLISENKEGIPRKDKTEHIPLTTIGLFNCKSTFTPDTIIHDQLSSYFSPEERALEYSLFDLAHRLPDNLKKILLNKLYDMVQKADKSETLPVGFDTLKHPISELAHSILRQAFYVPYLTLGLYLDLRKHLSANDSEPLLAAIKQNNELIILLLLDCKIELSEIKKEKMLAEINELLRWPCEYRHSGEEDFLMGYQFYIGCTKDLREQKHSSSII